MTRRSASFAYAWLRCDFTAPTTCAAIPGATTGVYTTTTNDQTANGSVIRVEVTATPAVESVDGCDPTPPSAVSANEPRNITPPSIVVPGGGVRVGATLQVQAGTWSRFPTISATEYQWSCSGGGAGVPRRPDHRGDRLLVHPDGGPTRRHHPRRPRPPASPIPVPLPTAPRSVPSCSRRRRRREPRRRILCRILTAVTSQGTGAVDISVANPHIRLNFANATVTSTTCTTDVVIDITGASIELFDWMRIEGVNVHITNTAVDITGGTLTVPGDATLSAMNFRVITDGLHIPLERRRRRDQHRRPRHRRFAALPAPAGRLAGRRPDRLLVVGRRPADQLRCDRLGQRGRCGDDFARCAPVPPANAASVGAARIDGD